MKSPTERCEKSPFKKELHGWDPVAVFSSASGNVEDAGNAKATIEIDRCRFCGDIAVVIRVRVDGKDTTFYVDAFQ